MRKTLRTRRSALGAVEQQNAAQALTASVLQLPNWVSAQRIALYLAADGEIDTKPLEKIARYSGKKVFLPVITNSDSLEFARWETADTLSNNRYNIPEPPETAPRCPAGDLNIIFLPLVGWDLCGHRLGMGGGFYDRTLAEISGPLLVGLAHQHQQVDEVPREDWDVVLEYVATDTALYRCQRQ